MRDKEVHKNDQHQQHVHRLLHCQQQGLQSKANSRHGGVGHGQGGEEADGEADETRRLRQRQEVGHWVEEPGAGEDAEVQDGGGQSRWCGHIQQADQDERDHVLQVIQVASATRLG